MKASWKWLNKKNSHLRQPRKQKHLWDELCLFDCRDVAFETSFLVGGSRKSHKSQTHRIYTRTGLLIKGTTYTHTHTYTLFEVQYSLDVFILSLRDPLVRLQFIFNFLGIKKRAQKVVFKTSFTSPRVNIVQAHPHQSLPFLRQFERLWHHRSSCHHQWLQWHLRSPSWPG